MEEVNSGKHQTTTCGAIDSTFAPFNAGQGAYLPQFGGLAFMKRAIRIQRHMVGECALWGEERCPLETGFNGLDQVAFHWAIFSHCRKVRHGACRVLNPMQYTTVTVFRAMVSFYVARGFPEADISKFLAQSFVAVHLIDMDPDYSSFVNRKNTLGRFVRESLGIASNIISASHEL